MEEKRRPRYLRLQLTDNEWFKLLEFKAQLHCQTWDDFARKLIKNKDILIKALTSLPP